MTLPTFRHANANVLAALEGHLRRRWVQALLFGVVFLLAWLSAQKVAHAALVLGW